MPNASKNKPTGSTGKTSKRRPKTVFTSREVPHLWANSPDPHTIRGGNLSTVGTGQPCRWLVSYSTPVAVRIRTKAGPVFLIVRNDYSVSTGRHIGDAHHAVPIEHRDKRFTVPCLSGGRHGKRFDRYGSHTCAPLDREAHDANLQWLADRVRNEAENLDFASPSMQTRALSALQESNGDHEAAALRYIAFLNEGIATCERYRAFLTPRRKPFDFSKEIAEARAGFARVLALAKTKQAARERKVAEHVAAAERYALDLRRALVSFGDSFRTEAAGRVRAIIKNGAIDAAAAVKYWRENGTWSASARGWSVTYGEAVADTVELIKARLQSYTDNPELYLGKMSVEVIEGLDTLGHRHTSHQIRAEADCPFERISRNFANSGNTVTLLRLANFDPLALCRDSDLTLTDWEQSLIPRRNWITDGFDLLRVNQGESVIETSAGARLPLSLARACWNLLAPYALAAEAGRYAGHPEDKPLEAPDMAGRHLGPYAIAADGLYPGHVIVGCHRIRWAELTSLARTLGFPADAAGMA